MSCILNIETSTTVCSVAVSNDAECIFNKEDHSDPHHNETLLGEHPNEEDALLVPMLDACRMEVYAEVFDRALHVVRPIQADVVTEETYKTYLDKGIVYFFGDGAGKCMSEINHPNARYIKDILPLAKNMFPLAEKRFAEEKFEDVAYFVPFYLKDFVAKMPKKLL